MRTAPASDRAEVRRRSQLFLLEAGRHELRFAAREDGTNLDRVVVTNDLVEVPAGTAGG